MNKPNNKRRDRKFNRSKGPKNNNRSRGPRGRKQQDTKKLSYQDKRNLLLERIRKEVGESLQREDKLIIQSVKTIENYDRILNLTYERLEEWAVMYHPELKYNNMESLILKIKDRKNPQQIIILLNDIEILTKDKETIIKDIIEKTEKLCPNMSYMIGAELSAKLLESAGSLHKMSRFPASTIQVLGAEKALFKHLRTGARPPKHGLLFQLPTINRASKRIRGKLARTIATKLIIAVRADAITKNFIAEKLKKDMDKQVNHILKNKG